MDKLPEYRMVEDSFFQHDTCPIEIMSGPFKNIIYKYGQISLKELEGENLQVNMNIDIIKAPEGFDQNDKDFTQAIGEIFVDIVETKGIVSDPVDLESDVHEDPVDRP